MAEPQVVTQGLALVDLAGLGVSLCAVWITALALLWKYLDKRFDQERDRLLLIEQQFQAFRSEVYRDFVRISDSQTHGDEMRKLIHEVFDRLNALARDVNLLIGERRGRNHA